MLKEEFSESPLLVACQPRTDPVEQGLLLQQGLSDLAVVLLHSLRLVGHLAVTGE